MWVVPGSEALACPVAPAAGSLSISTELVYNFPRSVFMTGVLVIPTPDSVAFPSGLLTQLSQLKLAITDEVNQPIFNDTRGTVRGTTRAPVAGPLLALFGAAFHPFAMQRPVAALDVWRFTIQNRDIANAQTIEGIYLFFEEPQ